MRQIFRKRNSFSFFRTDIEASGKFTQIEDSIDLSRLIKGKMVTRKQINGIALTFLSVIREVKKLKLIGYMLVSVLVFLEFLVIFILG